jgi:hypothetical protein
VTHRWIRVPPDRDDGARALLAAGAVAAGVGLITFYVTRLLLAREKLQGGGPPGGAGDVTEEGGGA